MYDAQREQHLADGTWRRERIWRWPPPGRLGLDLDDDEQEVVRRVQTDSPAHAAGLRSGDRLTSLDGQRILSRLDVSWVLEQSGAGARALEVVYERSGQERRARLRLVRGWKEGTPLSFSWRPSKWQLRPRPGKDRILCKSDR